MATLQEQIAAAKTARQALQLKKDQEKTLLDQLGVLQTEIYNDEQAYNKMLDAAVDTVPAV